MTTGETHRCPAPDCTIQVPDRLLACPPHWAALSHRTKQAIRATARMHPLRPARRAALRAALDEWRSA